MRRVVLALLAVPALVLSSGQAPASAAPDVAPASAPAPGAPLAATDFSVSPPSAGSTFVGSARRLFPGRGGYAATGVGLWREGTLSATRVAPSLSGTGRFFVDAGADVCEGGPTMVVSVGGAEVLRQVVDVDHGTYEIPGNHPGGIASLDIAMEGERRTATCDRSLKVYGVQDTSYGPGVRISPYALEPVSGRLWPVSTTAEGAERPVAAGGSVLARFTTAATGRAWLYVDVTTTSNCGSGYDFVTVVLDGGTFNVSAYMLPNERRRLAFDLRGTLAPGPHTITVNAFDTGRSRDCASLVVREVGLVAQR